MRRRVLPLVLAVLSAAVGAGSAFADGSTTAGTTSTTTTTATTTGASTTTPAPSYAPLTNSLLPTGCVGAGAAAVVPPSHSTIALGTPAANLGPSGYPASASVLAFSSSTASGSTCGSAQVTLSSVSLFAGAVTATSVTATDGRGTVSGLEISGSAVSATAGQTVPVEGWGQLTLGATVGRLRAPLIVRLLQAHSGLLAGTTVAIAFAAVPQSRTKPKRPSARASSNTQSGQHANAASGKKKHQPRPQKPPPDFPAAPFPFTLGGSLTEAAQDNPVVSIATKYLGIPYLWGGASPKTGFDCSGLVMYVFAQLGVELTHYAAAQYHTPDGVWVAPNQLQSGDLVFFTGSDGTRKAPGHVGIYVGDGYLIDAPQTGTDVRIDNLDEPKLADQYVGARRIVTPLVTRHLFRVSSHGVRSPGILARAFPQESGLAAAGESTPGIAAVAFRSASGGFPLWVGGPLGGLLILLLAGAVVFRRYRSAPDATSSKPSD